MIAMTLGEIAEVVAASGQRAGVHDADPGTPVTGAAFLDSRDPVPGGLFVALAGDHVDGHDFASGAVAGGAAAALAARPTGVPSVVVGDVRAALQALARVVLERLRARGGPVVVGITGSQGKTSVKDMLAAVLAAGGPTVATYGSFNNELGLPLTVLRAGTSTRFLVLEMGARGAGHIAELCAIAPPDIAVVVNVGQAHLGEFGSQDAITRAKGELVEALSPGGTAVLNHDDARVAAMTARTTERVLTFGTTPGADVGMADLRLDDLGRPAFTLTYAGETAEVALRLLGEHQAVNAAAAAATALVAGVPLPATASALAGVAALSPWRMELSERDDGLIVVNDAYNANPESMAAALDTLAGIGARTGRRTLAVLGEMRELGGAGDAEHRRVGLLTMELGIDRLVVVGEGARAMGETNDTSVLVEGVADAVTWLRENVRGSDVVLVKASRAAGLERVARALLEQAPLEQAPEEERP